MCMLLIVACVCHAVQWAAHFRLGRRGVGMALLVPLPGVRGRLFASDKYFAQDDAALALINPALIINLTTRPRRGADLDTG